MDIGFLGMLFNGFLDLLDFLSGRFGAFRCWIFVSVRVLHFRFLAGLDLFDSSRGRVFPVMLLFLQNLLIVSDIAWIGHRPMNRRSLTARLVLISGKRGIF